MQPNEVNKQAMRAWIVALRSGDYPQGMGRLVRQNGDGNLAYCCLGVACEVAIANGVKGIKRAEGDFPSLGDILGYEYGIEGLVENANLPTEVHSWINMGTQEIPCGDGCLVRQMKPVLHGDGLRAHAIYALNDSYQLTFTRIADILERTFLKEETE